MWKLLDNFYQFEVWLCCLIAFLNHMFSLWFTLQIQQEFGSFSNYCWSFVNYKPIRNGFRYARQVPVKTPKAETISKDLMHRGFRCVGPSVVYSFMQVAGLANDHLVTCFRYHECNNIVENDQKPKTEDIEVWTNENNTCSSHDWITLAARFLILHLYTESLMQKCTMSKSCEKLMIIS